MSWRRAPAALLVMVLSAAACGGGDGEDETSAQEDSGSEQTSDATAEGSGSGESSDDGDDPDRFALVPPGPADPDFIGGTSYELLTQPGRCQDVLDNIEANSSADEAPFLLYKAAAEACLGNWDQAEADFARYDQSTPVSEGNCGRELVVAWVEQLLAAHDADPGFSPIFAEAPRRPECPEGGSSDDGSTDETTDETTDDTTGGNDGTTSGTS